MRKQKRLGLLSTLLALLFGFAMASCGGGGGSSSSLSYTGETSQATITDANAQGLLTYAYMGGDMGSFPVPLGTVAGGQEDHPKDSMVLTLPNILMEAVNRIDKSGLEGSAATGTIVSDSQTINGSCGGSASISISFDDVTGDFSGSFVFRSYDECSEVINGGISFSGRFEIVQGPQGPEVGEILNMTMSFSALSVSGGESATIAGQITVTVNGTTDSITMDLLLHDGLSDQVFWVNNYSVTVTDMGTYEEVQVTGTFYDPVEGYVDITTVVVLEIDFGADWPRAGQILISGAGGTRALLRAQSDGTFFVDVDIDVDPDYEFIDLGPFMWDTV